MNLKKTDILTYVILFLVTINILLILYTIFSPINGFSKFINNRYSYICHQDEECILFSKTVSLPLCYRCLGMHTFFFIGAWLYVLYFFRKRKKFSFIFLIAFTVPIIIDGLFKISRHLNNHYLSFLTGALFGFACIVCIFQGLKS